MGLGNKAIAIACLVILLTSILGYGGLASAQKKLSVQTFQGVKEGDVIRFYFILNDGEAYDGQAQFKILDNAGNILYQDEFDVKASDYKDYVYQLTGTSAGKAYEWYVQFNQINKGVADILGYGKAQLQFTTSGQTLSAEAAVEIPAITKEQTIAAYENSYVKKATPVDKTITKGYFQVTLVRVGYYKHLEYDTWGDEVTDFRADIKVKNIGSEEETFSTYDAAIIIGNSQYDAKLFRSKFDGYNLRPGIVREGYLIFETPITLKGQGEIIAGSYYNYPEGEIEYKFSFDFDNLTKEVPSLQLVPKLEKMKIRIEKSSYVIGETVKISGKVHEVSSARGSIVIINPKGEVYSSLEFYPNSDGNFVTQFELKESRFAIAGVWKVKASYLSEAAETSITVSIPHKVEPIIISTDKTSYKIGETVKINGRVNDPQCKGSIVLLNPNLSQYSGVTFAPDHNGNFVTQFILERNERVVSGLWTVRATCDEQVGETTTRIIMQDLQIEKETKQDISVSMKIKKKSILLALNNKGEVPVYGLELKTIDGSNIKYVKAKGWDRQKIDPSTIIIQTDDRPLIQGRSMIVILITDEKNPWLEWKAFDVSRNVVSVGELIPR